MTADRPGRRAGLVVTCHPFEAGAARAGEIRDEAARLLAGAGIQVVETPEPVQDVQGAVEAATALAREQVDALVVRLATWTDDTLLLAMVDALDVPVISWAHRDIDAGSLCGAQQFNMVLRELGKPSRVVIGTGARATRQIREVLRDLPPRASPVAPPLPAELASIARRLRRLTVGIIGTRTQGMMEVACDEFSIKEVLGPAVLAFPVHLIEQAGQEIRDEIVENAMHAFTREHPGVAIDVDAGSFQRAIRFHLALEALVRSRGLGAVTIECYPRDMGKACLSFSLLAEAGIACACEGDVHAAILAWIMQQLSGEPVNHVDLLDVDELANTICGGHCGSCSITLAAPGCVPRVVPVRLAGEGACITFSGRAGPVTLANLVGRKGTYRAMIVEGMALDQPAAFPGATVTARLDAPVGSFMDAIEGHGMGHHWIVARGTCKDRLAALLAATGVRVVG